jgi:hypothetical protein
METEPWEVLNNLLEDIDVTEKYHPFVNRIQKLARDMKNAASE